MSIKLNLVENLQKIQGLLVDQDNQWFFSLMTLSPNILILMDQFCSPTWVKMMSAWKNCTERKSCIENCTEQNKTLKKGFCQKQTVTVNKYSIMHTHGVFCTLTDFTDSRQAKHSTCKLNLCRSPFGTSSHVVWDKQYRDFS